MNNKFIMLVGLTGSGKSYYAKTLKGYKVFSSDSYRAIIGENENDQTVNNEVFKKLLEDIKYELLMGSDVVLDATNLSSKRRRHWCNELKDYEKECHVILTSFEQCLKNNSERDRNLPCYVMKKMYKNFEMPYLEEGWSDIKLVYPFNEENKYNLQDYLSQVEEYNQDSKYHTKTLGEHSNSVKDYIIDNYNGKRLKELYIAGLLHDNGKIYTKTYVNRKGDTDTYAHYYYHENVGAYNSLFYDLQDIDKQYVAWLINNHMKMMYWKNCNLDKIEKKYKKLWGEDRFNDLMTLYKADREAH